MLPQTTQQKVFSVSELTRSIKGMLEGRFAFISVAGEISGLRRPGSGHLYFTLKDDQAQIKAVLFKMQQRYLQQLPNDGDMVICLGRVSVYELGAITSSSSTAWIIMEKVLCSSPLSS